MKMLNRLTVAIAMTVAVPLTVFAAGDPGNMEGMADMKGMAGMPEAKSERQALSQGEVKKVDAEQGKMTIKHGPLENLGMPSMTMVFRVPDAGLLGGIKPGDMIRFKAEKIDGSFAVTQVER